MSLKKYHIIRNGVNRKKRDGLAVVGREKTSHFPPQLPSGMKIAAQRECGMQSILDNHVLDVSR
jgi:hypothetical protein